MNWEGRREKLSRYHAAGVQEVVRFDPDGSEGSRLRGWDRVDADLVERTVANDCARCQTLGLWWTVCAAAGEQVASRLAADPEGTDLLPTPEEAEENARQAEMRLRQGAEQRKQRSRPSFASSSRAVD